MASLDGLPALGPSPKQTLPASRYLRFSPDSGELTRMQGPLLNLSMFGPFVAGEGGHEKAACTYNSPAVVFVYAAGFLN